MIPFIGNFAEDATVYHYFNTFSSNDPAASVTITNLADTDIYVYKDGSVTDLATDGASVVIDFDARTGVHKLTIDTSVHADYSIGSDYMVLIEGTTVDAGTVTAGIFTFSIENRYNDVNVVTVSGTAQTANDNGADVNTLLTRIVGTLAAGTHNPASAAEIAVLTDWINGGRLNNLLDAIPTTAMRGTDNAALASVATEARLSELDAATAGKAANQIDEIRTDTGEIGTAGAGLTNINLPNQTMDITGNLSGSVGSVTGAVASVTGAVGSVTGNIGGSVGSVTGAVGSVSGNVDGNVTGSVGSLVGHTGQTGDNFARIGAPAGISVSADIVAVKADTAAVKVVTDVQGKIVTPFTVSGTPTTTTMDTNLTITDATQLNDRVITFDDDTATVGLRGAQTDVTGSVALNGQLTVTALTRAPASGDTGTIT